VANREELDDLDRTVISMLTEDGRLSASEIAGRIGNVSERTIRNRIAALLQNRHIVIGAIPDPTASSHDAQADLWIDVEPGKVDEVAALLGEYDEVGYLAAVTGQYTLTAAIFFDTNAELFEFTENVIGKIPGVNKVVINMILRMYKIYGTRTTALSQREPQPNGAGRRARRTK
jgi:DNA-binding Lrp family transcriptional regulator